VINDGPVLLIVEKYRGHTPGDPRVEAAFDELKPGLPTWKDSKIFRRRPNT